ncbi:MAG: hypothetical protein K2X93_29015 [Candidatus Obscuribacterales bacterium]|nr:hypothetical protein [Candidatus Obscuribacterales bacterium]
MAKPSQNVNCSFCGETSKKAKKMIAGPKVHICDKCIRKCNSLLDNQSIVATLSPEPLDFSPQPDFEE